MRQRDADDPRSQFSVSFVTPPRLGRINARRL